MCPNETELAVLSGLPVVDVPTAITAARSLCEQGSAHVLVTLGEKGCLLVARDNVDTVHVPTAAVTAVDTTGAGDSFLGAFGAFLSQGFDVSECMRRANIVASFSVLRNGTQSSYGRLSDFSF
jgi:ribokinase